MGKLRKPQPTQGKKLSLSSSVGNTQVDYNREKPTFCLRHMDVQYSITRCDVNEKASFAEALFNLSQLTWNELRSTPHRGMGCEKIERASIRRPVPLTITEDAAFLAFRFHGKKAMVGFRSNEVFHIVWLDRDYTLYDHG